MAKSTKVWSLNQGEHMPVIVIENYKSSDTLPDNPHLRQGGPRFDGEWRHHVRKAMFDAFIGAHVPGITQREQVTIVFGGRYEDDVPVVSGRPLMDALNPKMAVVFVEGLYDTPERTNQVRERMAKALGKALIRFLPFGWKVEVLPKRYNPDKDMAVTVENDDPRFEEPLPSGESMMHRDDPR